MTCIYFLRCSFASAMSGKKFISQSNVDWRSPSNGNFIFDYSAPSSRPCWGKKDWHIKLAMDFSFLLRKRIPHWNGRLTSAQIWNTIKCILIELLLTWSLQYLRIISSCIMLFAFRFKLSPFAMMSCRACSNLASASLSCKLFFKKALIIKWIFVTFNVLLFVSSYWTLWYSIIEKETNCTMKLPRFFLNY